MIPVKYWTISKIRPLITTSFRFIQSNKTTTIPIVLNKKANRSFIRNQYEAVDLFGDLPKQDPRLKVDQNLPPLVEVSKDFVPTKERIPGEIAAFLPFRMELEPGKTYNWCRCGKSQNQPFCDYRHNYHNTFVYKENSSTDMKSQKYFPIKFQVKEKKNYYLCRCKRTKTPPFCDGTHRTLPTGRQH